MKFNSVKRGNFSGLANSVMRNADAIFKAGRDTAVDNTKIAQEAIKGRSMERRAAMKAEANVAQAGLKAFAKTKDTQNQIESAEKISAIKRPAKRMAGIVAGLGAISQAAVTNKNLKDDKAERDALRRDQQAVWDRQTELFEESKAERERIKGLLEQQNQPGSSTTDETETQTLPKPEGSGDEVSDPQPRAFKKVSPDISAQSAAGPGKLNRSQITKLAVDAGFTPEQAQTVYGIAGGESGFDPTNSTERSGLKARTGEDSVGLMQINWGYHKDRGWLQGLGINSREDLFDPAKNMKAAKYLYDGRGNFGDWTVFNKGIYKDYL